MIAALFWKEAREHFPRMLFILGALLLLVLLAITPGFDFTNVWMTASFISAIWIGAHSLTTESTRRTQGTLFALPVLPRRFFDAKVLCGLATFLLPLAMTFLLHFQEENVNDLIMAPTFLYASATLYLIVLATGVGIRREGTAAVLGILVLLASAVWLGTIEDLLRGHDVLSWLLLLPNPFVLSFLASSEASPRMWELALPIQGIFLASLLTFAGWRFGRQTLRLRVEHAPVTRSPRVILLIPMPFRHPLLWKEMREQFAAIIAAGSTGLGVAVLVSLVLFETTAHPTLRTTIHDSLGIVIRIGVIVPAVMAAILGIFSTSAELDPPLQTFWRSRPILGSRLFWIKFLVAFFGIALLAVCFDLPYFLIARPLEHLYPDIHYDQSFHMSMLGVLLRESIGLSLILALSTLFGVLLRRATYAGIAVFVAAFGILAFPLGGRMEVSDVFFVVSSPGWFFPIAGFFLVLAILATWTAHYAFTHPSRIR